MKISVINGPNLNLLGRRKVEVYGTVTLTEIEARLRKVAEELGVETDFFQSNSEGALVDHIGETLFNGTDGIVINPAAYTHTSVAVRDALEAVRLPAVEVHISNIHTREEFRHRSLTAPVCGERVCAIIGFAFCPPRLMQRCMSSASILNPAAAPAGETIDSPIVGTFYRSSAPGVDAFVKIGSKVEPDTTVCIIEAMKVMNEIKAEKSGVIKEILAENGQPVEYGQPLFVIE